MMLDQNNETPIHTNLWSACLALVAVFAVIDVLAGGHITESFFSGAHVYAPVVFFLIAGAMVTAKESPPRLALARTFSRQKL